jgi:hypothetical protein
MPEGVPNFKYKDDYSPRLQPLNRTALNPAEDEEIELGLHQADDEPVSDELRELYNSFQVGHITSYTDILRFQLIVVHFSDMYRSAREVHRPFVPTTRG